MNNMLKEKEKAEEALKKARKELKSIRVKSNVGVRVIKKGKSLQCYVRDSSKKSMYRYVSGKEKDEAINIVRKSYYEKAEQVASKELKLINALINLLEKNSIENIHKKIGECKSQLVDPVIVSDEKFIEEWLGVEYRGKTFEESNLEIYTEKGERVRSKSEKIIADKLLKEKVPYRYEYPLEIPAWGKVYPDFTILDVENKRNIIFEHFGLMDDMDYANNAIAKIQMYANAGYVLGDNFFMTLETSQRPLDSRVLDGVVKQLKSKI